ncbi:MAG: hypothetical protein RBG13Loki_1968 [Promethearchaeota archaeon CR_4]|nr:MAG: hypothetical protein RBG13Loki_1968 [Candidatus Lokiarchaeota archaeon CR_4]
MVKGMTLPKQKIISLIIAILSLVGMILLLAADFAGFYLTGYYSGERYACLICEYRTDGTLAAQIIGSILLAV